MLFVISCKFIGLASYNMPPSSARPTASSENNDLLSGSHIQHASWHYTAHRAPASPPPRAADPLQPPPGANNAKSTGMKPPTNAKAPGRPRWRLAEPTERRRFGPPLDTSPIPKPAIGMVTRTLVSPGIVQNSSEHKEKYQTLFLGMLPRGTTAGKVHE